MFWWGTTPDHKRVQWLKWSELCRPKSKGGLGFRDLSMFNQAMLGKQVWRLITKPDSLIARVLKAKYFPSSSIWEAHDKTNSSYMWRSILWGRNLVAQGVRWRVGNGSSIQIYQSRWLPTRKNFQVISPRTLPQDSKVSVLMDEFGRWNKALIRVSFLEVEANIILGLPRPSSHYPDCYYWHYEKKGIFSVKTVYHLGISTLVDSDPSPSMSSISSSWNSLWSMAIPQKIKVFW
ncbi:hypothetical protein UlMin_020013 [Ulmus minor]